MHPHERIVRGIKDQPHARLVFGEPLHRLLPLVLGDRRADEIGDRQREVPFVDRPVARRADVFHAQHASRRVALAQRHVQHGADAVRLKIAVGELAGALVAVSVGRGDHPFALDRFEIHRALFPRKHVARRVPPGSPLVQIDAPQVRPVVAEEPHADPLHMERPRRRLEQLRQPRLEAGRRRGLLCRQRGQRLALLCQPLLACPQRLLRVHLLRDVVEHREDRRFTLDRDHARGGAQPAGRTGGLANLQQDVVGPAVTPKALDEQAALLRVDVEVGHLATDDVRGRDADDLEGLAIDRDHHIVGQAAEDGRKWACVEELAVGRGSQKDSHSLAETSSGPGSRQSIQAA